MSKRKYSVVKGQRFERLEVVREVEPVKGKRRVLCKCDCGELATVDLYQLVNGQTKSCGCLGRENLDRARRPTDLTGREFNRLTAKYMDGVKNGNALWVCECKCGNYVSVPARDLLNGNTQSCGCIIREFAQSLAKHNKQHHTIDDVFVPLLRQKVQSNNKTGFKGVSIRKGKNGKVQYISNITIKGKRHYLGIYQTLDEAVNARQAAEERYHKPYLEDNHDETN